MKKTILYKTVALTADEEGRGDIVLNYYITYEPMYSGFRDPARYGIIIEKLMPGKAPERAEVSDMCYSHDDASRFTDMLVRNTVTPVHLRGVVEEYITGLIKHTEQVK